MRLADTSQGNRGSGRQMRRFTRQVASGNTSRERLRKKPGAAGRQRHRCHYHEPDDYRHVAGAAQGDCSPHDGDPIRGLIVMPDGFMNVHRAEIVSLAARYIYLSSLSACRDLRRAHPARYRADRPSSPGPGQSSTGNQPQDGQGARPDDPVVGAAPGVHELAMIPRL